MMMMSKEVSDMSCSLTSSSLPLRERGKKEFGGSALHHHHDRIFDQHLEGADQFGPERAVDRAVIAGHRHAHDLGDLDLAVLHNRALIAGADRENGCVRGGGYPGRSPRARQ